MNIFFSSLYPLNSEDGFTLSICPSVHPTSCVCSVAPTVLVGSISYLYILLSNFRRCVTCTVYCKIIKFEFLAIFQICNFVLFWLGNLCESWGIGGISERRHSSCFSYLLIFPFMFVLLWYLLKVYSKCIYSVPPSNTMHEICHCILLSFWSQWLQVFRIQVFYFQQTYIGT